MLENLTSGNTKAAMKDAGAGSSDLWKVPAGEIVVMDDFNVRTHDEAYEAHVEWITSSIIENGFWNSEPLTCFVARRDGQSILCLIDGHTRLEAAKRAIARGTDIGPLPVVTKPAGTQAEDLLVGLVVHNSGKPLTPIEKAAVVKKLVDYGMEVSTIAKRLSFSAVYINDLLTLIGAPKKIRTMVEAGEVSASNATVAIKKHGEKATEVLTTTLETAKASGKTRVTEKTLQNKTPRANKVLDLGVAYIREHAGGVALIAMLAHIAGVEVAAVEAQIQAA